MMTRTTGRRAFLCPLFHRHAYATRRSWLLPSFKHQPLIMVLSCSFVSLGALEKLPFFKCAADSGIPGKCANDLSRRRPLRSMVLEDRIDAIGTSALAKLHNLSRSCCSRAPRLKYCFTTAVHLGNTQLQFAFGQGEFRICISCW
jgi:hypothetical protein